MIIIPVGISGNAIYQSNQTQKKTQKLQNRQKTKYKNCSVVYKNMFPDCSC